MQLCLLCHMQTQLPMDCFMLVVLWAPALASMEKQTTLVVAKGLSGWQGEPRAIQWRSGDCAKFISVGCAPGRADWERIGAADSKLIVFGAFTGFHVEVGCFWSSPRLLGTEG